ncbi:hypothetical protein [Anaerocaecibacter muris]|uniref:hypothetical protein n=1 Tax=Anaerocaecibacter muris TaxID=2941513 RepID=UPI003F68F2F3
MGENMRLSGCLSESSHSEKSRERMGLYLRELTAIVRDEREYGLNFIINRYFGRVLIKF